MIWFNGIYAGLFGRNHWAEVIVKSLGLDDEDFSFSMCDAFVCLHYGEPHIVVYVRGLPNVSDRVKQHHDFSGIETDGDGYCSFFFCLPGKYESALMHLCTEEEWHPSEKWLRAAERIEAGAPDIIEKASMVAGLENDLDID